MSQSSRLRLADHRAIWELTNECRELGDDVSVWRRHLSAGLSRLCGGDFLVTTGEMGDRGGQIRVLESVEWGWEHGYNRTAFYQALAEYGERMEVSPVLSSYYRRPTGTDGACLRRCELVPDREWYPTRFFALVSDSIGIDHTLSSFRAFPDRPGVSHGICVTRQRAVRQDFIDRQRAVVEEVQRLVVPMTGGSLAGFAEPSPSALAPRVRAVLACLLEGDSDKQVAARLRLSVYTVNQYAKVIFTHFGVTSRPELLARWIKRGWGSKGGWRPEGME